MGWRGRVVTLWAVSLAALVAVPAGAAPCDGVTAAGCCDGTTVKYCKADGTLAKVNCAAFGLSPCDWSTANQFFMCQPDDPGAPPPESPKMCPGAPTACMPDCTGKACGDDGCGGTCGTCAVGSTCENTSGVCVDDTKKPCGDIPAEGCCDGTVVRVCMGGSLLMANCLGVHGTCAYDPNAPPGAPKNFCTQSANPDQSGYVACPKPVCVPKCDGKSCGDDGCGGTCGTCNTDQTCDVQKGLCACKPDCTGKTCGDDGCGGSCGACKSGETCDDKSKVVCGIANDFEDLTLTCPAGSVITAVKFAEYGSVYGACPSPSAGACTANNEAAFISQKCLGQNSCTTTNWHLTLGDPCPNVGKKMAAMVTCSTGGGGAQCKCKPDCTGKSCGDDGCGGSCGTCGGGKTCDAGGQCLAPAPTCGVPNAFGTGSLTALPVDLSGVKDVKSHASFMVALKNDGTVVAWGDKADPVVTGAVGKKDAVSLAVGPLHAGIVKKDGTIEVWGACSGFGDTACQVPAGLKDVAQLAFGVTFGIALKTDGTVVYWPDNADLPGFKDLKGVVAIAAGAGSGAAAIKADGTVFIHHPGNPAAVTDMPAGLKANRIFLRNCYVAAVKPDGTVAVWGSCTDMAKFQTSVDKVVALSGGNNFLVAVREDGLATAWGPEADKIQAQLAGLKGVTAVGGGLETLGVALTCSQACSAVSQFGCCEGNVLKTCAGPDGALQTQSCAAGTCGWQGATGAFQCDTTGASSPGNQWLKTCTYPLVCAPNCTGKTCGDDGCGGTCGTCAAGLVCDPTNKCAAYDDCAGKGVATKLPDNKGEDFHGCCAGAVLHGCKKTYSQQLKKFVNTYFEVDCGAKGWLCTWNKYTGLSYACNNVDYGADPSGKYPKACANTCASKCVGKTCGPDGCGGQCGTCKAGYVCDATQNCKVDCTPQCTGKTCGDDGCGGSCGNCGAGMACKASQCVVDPCEGISDAGCCDGNTRKLCSKGKLVVTACGDDGLQCSFSKIVKQYTCKTKDDVPPDLSADFPKKCPDAKCAAVCYGKQCGSDGCGGTCGQCSAGYNCTDKGSCCIPNCWKKMSGPDGCGGFCGQCAPGYEFDTKEFYCKCKPTCDGKSCGSDGCGGSCGKCAVNGKCNFTTGQCACIKQCSGKICGPDGCGGSCGSCATGQGCEIGKCEPLCKPKCTGKTCGDDGCGGSCGACASSEFCDAKTSTCRSKMCPEVPSAGCCVGDIAKTCSAGGAASDACNKLGKVCGWDAAKKQYGCVDISGSVDPAGKNPRLCPGAPVCYPSCYDKYCGPDGCGGFCGTCKGGKQCDLASGKCKTSECLKVPSLGCCEGNTWVRCSEDVGEVYKTPCSAYGAGTVCGWAGSKYACFGSNGGDQPGGASVKACASGVCTPDCYGKKCGPDGCGGTCGQGCGAYWTCNGTGTGCVPACVPDCKGKQCGADGCGGTCGACADGGKCTEKGLCLVKDPCEGIPLATGCCDGNVKKFCLSGTVVTKTCDKGTCGWNKYGFYDCDTDGSPAPGGNAPWACGGAAACKPDCAGKLCGPDGCGGWCGQCGGKGEVCDQTNGKCVVSCGGVPMDGCCDGNVLKWCGKIGGNEDYTNVFDCGASKPACGWNPGGSGAYSCNTSGAADPKGFRPKACPKPDCTPQCDGKQCGDDGCGGACGTCATGTSCFAQTGKCVTTATAAACGDVKWEGGCDGTSALYCSNGSLVTQQCSVGGKGECGWLSAIEAYGCGGNGADPSGTVNKTAPGAKTACVPSCSGKECGADGCGGSCGTCAKGAACLSSGKCGAPGKSFSVPAAGCCHDDSTVITAVGGGSIVSGCTGGTPDCGFDDDDQQFVCGKLGTAGFSQEDPNGLKKRACPACPNPTLPSDGPCTFNGCGQQKGVCTAGNACDYKSGQCKPDNNGSCSGNKPSADGSGEYCGAPFNASWSCQCDTQCQTRGDCCNNFEGSCGKKVYGTQVCGNGTCEASAGETCITCGADCGSCKWPETNGNFGPPFSAPYGQVVALPGSPASHARFVYDPLDAVLPSGSPLPLAGLLAYLPQMGIKAGPPAAQFLEGALPGKEGKGVVKDLFPSKQGSGWTFAANPAAGTTLSTHGTLRVLAGTALPVAPSYARKEPGGYSVAFWVRVPTNAPDVPNPLMASRGSTLGDEVCAWSRPQDSAVTLSCPPVVGATNKIVSVEAYYGQVDTPAAPDGKCSTAATLRKSYRCHAAGIQAAVEKACLGKTSCHPNAWDVEQDPCSPPPHVPNQSTLVVRAVCDYSPVADGAMLVVEAGAGEGKLRFERAGFTPLRGKSDIKTGTWRHVALTFQPYGNDRFIGITSLYVDGGLEAVTTDLPSPDIREWVMGGATIAGAKSTWPTYTGGAVATVADFDELFVYGRAITEAEVHTLQKRPEHKLIRSWPAMAAAEVVRTGAWTYGGKATLAPVTAPQLLDGSTGQAVPAPHQGLSLPAGTTFRHTSPDNELSFLSQFTLVGWVRAGKLEAGKPLMKMTLDGKQEVTVAMSADCGGRGVVAWIGDKDIDKVKTKVNDCEHGLQVGEWAFVALTRQYGNLTVYVDGHEVGSAKSEGSVFAGAASLERTFETGNGVDLLWAGIFDQIKPADLQTWRSPGPAVWLDGGFYKDGANSKLRDFGAFHNNAVAGATDQVVAQDALGKSPLVPDGQGPLVLSGGGNSQAEVVAVPARGRLGGLNGSMTRKFTFSGRVVLGQSDSMVPLVSQVLPLPGLLLTTAYFRAKLLCSRSDTDGPQIACHVDVTAMDGGGTWHKWSSKERVAALYAGKKLTAQKALALEVPMDVAVAWDGWKPHVAFGTATLHDAKGALLPGKSLEVLDTGSTPGEQDKAASSVDGIDVMHFQLRPGLYGGAGKTFFWSNLRLYPRAVTDVELVRLTQYGCDQIDCGASGQFCKQAFSASTAVCAGCDANHLEASGVPGGQCLEKRGFFETCQSHVQCATGLCNNGRCSDTSQSKACKDACDELGRACVQTSQILGTWSCSTECLDYYRKPKQDGETGECSWSPASGLEDACTSHAQCLSGVCELAPSVKYGLGANWSPECAAGTCPGWTSGGKALECGKGPYAGGSYFGGATCPPVFAAAAVAAPQAKRCAAAKPEECSEAHRMSIVKKGAGLFGTDAISCQQCDQTTYGGKPLWLKGWNLMAPDVCKKLHTGLTNEAIGLKAGWNDLDAEPSFDLFQKFYFRQDKALLPEQIAQLEKDGVGPELITFMRGSEADRKKLREKYGRLWLGDCARTQLELSLSPGKWLEDKKTGETSMVYEQTLTSPFFDMSSNRQVCVANKFANGTPCPPPGANVPEAQADSFCDSGFCARDSHKCEKGVGRLEVDEAADRGDKQNSDGGDTGSMGLTQQNNGVLEARKVKSKPVQAVEVAGAPKPRKYSIGGGTAQNFGAFDAGGKDFFSMSIDMSVNPADKDGEFESSVFLVGIKIPQTGNPASSCGGPVFEEGKMKEPKPGEPMCKTWKAPGDAVPSLPKAALCIPAPIGCEESDASKASKLAKAKTVDKGKACWKKTTFAGPVPMLIIAELALEACYGVGTGVDSETMAPEFQMVPEINCEFSVKGGVGAEFGGVVEVIAGIKAAITIVNLAFPIKWGMAVEGAYEGGDKKAIVQDVYTVKYYRKVDIELTVLKLLLALFFEVNIGGDFGGINTSWEYELFSFEGLKFVWNIRDDVLSQIKVDLQKDFQEVK